MWWGDSLDSMHQAHRHLQRKTGLLDCGGMVVMKRPEMNGEIGEL